MRLWLPCPALGALLALPLAAPAAAQNRSSDNAVTQAEDAFGFSVGRESIGIYNAGQVRGFSPTAAGNVRIEGLYFDPIFGLSDMLVGSTSVKVGLSAQGYPFAAPSGIVDQTLAPAGPGIRRVGDRQCRQLGRPQSRGRRDGPDRLDPVARVSEYGADAPSIPTAPTISNMPRR